MNKHHHHDHHHPHKKPDSSGSCDPTSGSYPTSGSVDSGSMFVPPPSGSEPDMGSSGSSGPCKFDEKLALPDTIMTLISEVVQNMAQIQSVVNNMQAGSYQKAIADLLQLVTNIITHMILPKVVSQSAAHSQYMGTVDPAEPMMHDD